MDPRRFPLFPASSSEPTPAVFLFRFFRSDSIPSTVPHHATYLRSFLSTALCRFLFLQCNALPFFPFSKPPPHTIRATLLLPKMSPPVSASLKSVDPTIPTTYGLILRDFYSVRNSAEDNHFPMLVRGRAPEQPGASVSVLASRQSPAYFFLLSFLFVFFLP